MSQKSDIPALSVSAIPEGYADWLRQLKTDIVQAQQRAALSVNAELVQLYGRIGRDILQRQDAQGWGAKVVVRLANDLKDAFPGMRGFSSRNLKYMAFFPALPQRTIWAAACCPIAVVSYRDFVD